MTTVVAFGGAARRRRELDQELTRITPLLRALDGVTDAWVFGSAISDTSTATSDLDLLVVRRTDEPGPQRAFTLHAELAPRVPVDLFVYTPAEMAEPGRFVRSVLSRGKRLW